MLCLDADDATGQLVEGAMLYDLGLSCPVVETCNHSLLEQFVLIAWSTSSCAGVKREKCQLAPIPTMIPRAEPAFECSGDAKPAKRADVAKIRVVGL